MSQNPNRRDSNDPFDDESEEWSTQNDPFDDEWDDALPFAPEDIFEDEDDFEFVLEEVVSPLDDMDGDPFSVDPFDEDPFAVPTEIVPNPSARCAGCGTTWDRIRHDGRAGCASCYATFRAQLSGVMARVQRGETHVGKTPRAIEKRRLRLEHLRARRDNQLAVLQNRLQNAIAAEKYEEAAKLRDKIKIVSSTIVD